MKNLSIKTALFTMLVLISISGSAQNYTWVKGSNTLDPAGTYGSLGIPAAANSPGGRELPSNWKDASGNFWLFGGSGFDAFGTDDLLNDLWKYNIATNQWTWMKGDNVTDVAGVYGTMGTAASANKPGARETAASFTDASGNLWLFGGYGVDANSSYGELNDLWKFNVSTNQWTWIKGSNNALQPGVYGTMGVAAGANHPGARVGSLGWADLSGNLWIFGGEGYGASGSGDLNDLWKYNIATNQWTWMNGNNTVDQIGVYGSMGVPSASNKPGGRYLGYSWIDASGNLWMNGGYGYGTSPAFDDFMNDLWKYDIATNQWTWMKGSSVVGQPGIYGTMGVAAPLNVPGGRAAGAVWADVAGNFYLFGGVGNDVSNSNDFLNDIWKYSAATNQWTWIKGSNSVLQLSTYGTQGVPAAANTAGARYGCVGWTDASSSLWLFGGYGADDSGNSEGELNDLWRLGGCTSSPTISISSNTTNVCSGGSATLTASGANTYIWSNNQTGSVTVVSPLIGSNTYTSYGSNTAGCIASSTITLNGLAVPNVTAVTSRGIICKGEQVVITAGGANNYVWNTSPAAATASISVSPTVTTIYIVTGTSANGCQKTFSLTQTVQLCAGINGQEAPAALYSIYPNPNTGSFYIRASTLTKDNSLLIFDALGQMVFKGTVLAGENYMQADLQKGIYLYTIWQADQKMAAGKLVIE